jgi:hypothetical protein
VFPSFFSSFLARFSSLRSSFLRRRSAFSSFLGESESSGLIAVVEVEATGIELAPDVFPPVLDAGSNPKATAKASASNSLIFLISSALASAPVSISRLYQ